MDVACFIGALKALQGRIPLAEPRMHERRRIGRNIPLRAKRLAVYSAPPGPGPCAPASRTSTPRALSPAVAAGEPPGVLQCIQRQIAVAQLLVGLPELKVSNQKAGIEDGGLPRELDRRG